MIERSDLPKMWALMQVSFAQTMRKRAEMVGRNIFFLLLLYIFSQLWRVAFAEHGAQAITAEQGVWYLAGADWLLLAAPLVHSQFESDLRSGDVVYALGRPLSWTLSRIADGMGALFARMLGILPAAIGGSWLLAGAPDPGIAWALLLGPVAGMLLIVMATIMGLFAVWMHDVSPLWWIFVKFMMVLGGLIVPLTFYPQRFRDIANLTPFAHIVFGVGRMAFGEGLGVVATEAAHLLAWLVALVLFLSWLNAKALRAVQAGGG